MGGVVVKEYEVSFYYLITVKFIAQKLNSIELGLAGAKQYLYFKFILFILKVNGISYKQGDGTKSGGVQITSKDKVYIISFHKQLIL